jgi:hypothetical protein
MITQLRPEKAMFPDRWVIVVYYTLAGPSLAVIGGWKGGWMGADEWRRSSPIKKVERLDDRWVATTQSGSTYILLDDFVGTTVLSGSIVQNLLQEKVKGNTELDVLQTREEIK